MTRLKRVCILSVLCIVVSCDHAAATRKYREQADRYFAGQKYEQAAYLYNKALASDARNGPAYYGLAKSLVKLGRPRDAIRECERAVGVFPAGETQSIDARRDLAYLYLGYEPETKNLEAVEAIGVELCRRNPDSYDGRRILGNLALERANKWAATADKDLSRQQLKEAIDQYSRAVKLRPDDIEVLLPLARALAIDGQLAESEETFRRAIRAAPRTVSSYSELYRLLITTGKRNQSEEVLKTAAANGAGKRGPLLMLAAESAVLNRREDAIRVMLELAAANPAAHVVAGDLLVRLGDFDQAVSEFNLGLRADLPHKSVYQQRLIDTLISQGKNAEAERIAGEVLREQPHNAQASAAQGYLLWRRGDSSNARIKLEAATLADPSDYQALYYLARLHLQLRRDAEAEQLLRTVIKLKPDHWSARLTLSRLEFSRGEYQEAIRTANEIMDDAPANQTARLIREISQTMLNTTSVLKHQAEQPDPDLSLSEKSLSDGDYRAAEQHFISYQRAHSQAGRLAFESGESDAGDLMDSSAVYLKYSTWDTAVDGMRKLIGSRCKGFDFLSEVPGIWDLTGL